jgi:phosphopantetheinyl transferase (holo-ACP synthase)
VRAIAVDIAGVGDVAAWAGTHQASSAGSCGVFTALEQAQAKSSRLPDEWLACALAIKRAVVKALNEQGVGRDLSAVEVLEEPDGRWLAQLNSHLVEAARTKGIDELAVVVSEDPGATTATVVALGHATQDTSR